MPSGMNLSSFFRTSDVIYTKRPPASRKSARWAWDAHSEHGTVVRLRLLDGYWGAFYADGTGPHEIEAPNVLFNVANGKSPFTQHSSRK